MRGRVMFGLATLAFAATMGAGVLATVEPGTVTYLLFEGYSTPGAAYNLLYVDPITNVQPLNATWIDRWYRTEAYIDGRALACTAGALNSSGGCWLEFHITNASTNYDSRPVGNWNAGTGGGNYRSRSKALFKATTGGTYALDDNHYHDFYVPPIVCGPANNNCGNSPIVVPLTKSPEVKFTPPSVFFDLDGDGVKEQVAWPEAGDGGWLALDRNHNGIIDSGKELFGSVTRPGVVNGFDVLAADAHAAVIDADTPLYYDLVVWNDANMDGLTQAGELEPFSRYVTRLFLFYEPSGKRDPFGTFYRWQGQAVYVDGQQRPIYDVVPATIPH